MTANHRGAWLGAAAGLALGLVIGMNLAGIWPKIPLHASATENHENFSIATGLIDSGVEGLFFLDYLTGDLKAAVIDPKTGMFNAFFSYNISADFGARSPKYLMVTGLADIPRGRAGFQFSKCVVYIADTTTGAVGAYTVPWNSSLMASGKPQTDVFRRLDLKPFRTATVRDQ